MAKSRFGSHTKSELLSKWYYRPLRKGLAQTSVGGVLFWQITAAKNCLNKTFRSRENSRRKSSMDNNRATSVFPVKTSGLLVQTLCKNLFSTKGVWVNLVEKHIDM